MCVPELASEGRHNHLEMPTRSREWQGKPDGPHFACGNVFLYRSDKTVGGERGQRTNAQPPGGRVGRNREYKDTYMLPIQ